LAEPLLTGEEAARLLAVTENWVYDSVRAGRLPCIRLGPKFIRFTRSDLEAWVSERRGAGRTA
jgi:excisionase family DNA binding protein